MCCKDYILLQANFQIIKLKLNKIKFKIKQKYINLK